MKNRNIIIIFLILPIYISFVLLFSCTSTPMPQNPSVVIPDDFLGIVAGSTNPEEYQLLDELGACWILKTFYWRKIEKEKGIFDFSEFDELVDMAKSNGIKIIVILGYDTPWLDPEHKSKKYVSPENISHYLDYVEETILHFKGQVDVWQIWNEPNIIFWKGPRQDFYELTGLTALKIREVDPEACIIGGVFFRSPQGYIKAMGESGATNNLDGLAFHPYAVNPEGSMKVHDRFIKYLADINFDGSIWITEAGYPTRGIYPSKVSLIKLPSYVVKTITGAAARRTRAFLWYEMFDSYNKKEAPRTWNSEHFFGLVYPDYQKKDGAWAYELCSRFLPGSRYIPDFPNKENIPSNVKTFYFEGGISGNNTLILWKDGIGKIKLHLELPASAFLYDISNGSSKPVHSASLIEISKKPIIITFQGNSPPFIYK